MNRLKKNRFIYDPSLVLYLPLWKLDGASFADKSAYGHLCTVTGATWTPQGRVFDGISNVIDAPAQPRLAYNLDWTISLWIRCDSVPAALQFLVNNYDGATSRILLHRGTDNTIHGQYYNGAAYTVKQTAALTVGQFYLITLVNSSGTLTIYANLTPSTTAGTARLPGSGATTLRFGGNLNLVAANLFIGLIGEAWIYRRALTLLEIQNNYIATRWRYQ